ncbi:hypothetical protein AA309_13105 [Microvirga vignae]|uniref:AAA domain-containing protein n=1 Tax=Microvirga vignae TaxID=1225564 RepID=A0A0H1RCP0_9HYPH|nr:AAA family ATPase [Microvirga vignae]KLK92631.1 hypothetical protein AA309_13105 [Microvirga vignae]
MTYQLLPHRQNLTTKVDSVPTFVIQPNSSASQDDLLVKQLAGLGRRANVAQSLNEVRKHPDYGKGKSFVFVPNEAGDASLADAAIRFAEAESQNAFVVYITDTMSADAYKRLVRTNAGEWIKWDNLLQEIKDVFHGAGGTQTGSATDSATIISFLPAKGGVGNTTLALETGVYLASTQKRDARVAVLDLNFQSSTLADYVDLEPRFDIAEFIDRPERLDAQLVEILSNKHSTQVDIFSCPPRLALSHDMQAEVIFALLDEISKKYTYVLLDLPNYWHPWFDNVLQGASAVIVTGEGTVPSIRQIANKQKHLDELSIGPDRAAIVINGCQTNFLGRIDRKSEIERTFAGRQVFFVRRDTDAVTEAANTGRPMMQTSPRSSIGKNIRRIGSWIESIQTHSLKAS